MLSSHDNDDECLGWSSGLGGAPAPLFFCFGSEPPDVSSLPDSLFLSRSSRAVQGFPCLEKMATICYVLLNVAVICCAFFRVCLQRAAQTFNGNHFINHPGFFHRSPPDDLDAEVGHWASGLGRVGC